MLSLVSLMAPAPGQKGGMSLLLIQLLLIGMVFYFLILRPQSQARKKHAEMLTALKKGDDVITTGGLMGKVRDIKDDRVTIESGSSTVVVHRSRIIQVGESAPPQLPA
ncbi:MAG TPA: preprotein translocase subunit YajC [Gemmatimonadales bacterium]|nr:preprotein translocase subunit YajC [Gemmatimonadales bacterium]